MRTQPTTKFTRMRAQKRHPSAGSMLEPAQSESLSPCGDLQARIAKRAYQIFIERGADKWVCAQRLATSRARGSRLGRTAGTDSWLMTFFPSSDGAPRARSLAQAVELDQPDSDEELAKRVRIALKKDPFVNGDQSPRSQQKDLVPKRITGSVSEPARRRGGPSEYHPAFLTVSA
jgi:hypothetical protein